jgi:dihydroflavonol-4-reductase
MSPAPTDSFWHNTPVCVIGGTGFLGRHIVAQLLAAGASVRVLGLPGSGVGYAHPRLDVRTGYVQDPATVRGTVAGARVVFLAAGPVDVGPHAGQTLAVHAAALEQVLAAVPSTARLVVTSSIVAVGGTARGAVLDEDAPFPNASLRVGYVRAKRAVEEVALAAGRSRDVVVVNPGLLFGPDDPGPSIAGEMCLGFWRGYLPIAPGSGMNVADVRDVAAGHLLAAERGAAGRRYILGGENVRYPELFTELAAAAGLRGPLLPRFRPPLPGAALWAVATAAALGAAITGGKQLVTYELARMFRLTWFGSSARAETELGYRRRPLRETLADAFAWHAARARVAPGAVTRLWLWRARTRAAA